MARRKAIGDNPLDGLIQPAEVIEKKVEKKKEKVSDICIANPCTKKERITIQISSDIVERIKNAVFWTPGLTLASFAESAFTKAVDKLEKDEPFPQRHSELRAGRPLK